MAHATWNEIDLETRSFAYSVIWSSNRLLDHQQARLKDLQSKLQAAETGPRGDPYARILFEQLISKLNREIENLRKIENFDAAVRLRLAAAYQAMRRYREAALILEANDRGVAA